MTAFPSLIETANLTLRPFTNADAEAAYENSRMPNVAHMMSDMVLSSIEESQEWIRWLHKRSSDACDLFEIRAVALKDTGRCIGLIGFHAKPEINHETEILFAIRDDFQGQGYITEAAKQFIPYIFTRYNIQTLVAIVKPENIGSIKVIHKCGFSQLADRYVEYDGEQVRFHYYQLHKADSIV